MLDASAAFAAQLFFVTLPKKVARCGRAWLPASESVRVGLAVEFGYAAALDPLDEVEVAFGVGGCVVGEAERSGRAGLGRLVVVGDLLVEGKFRGAEGEFGRLVAVEEDQLAAKVGRDEGVAQPGEVAWGDQGDRAFGGVGQGLAVEAEAPQARGDVLRDEQFRRPAAGIDEEAVGVKQVLRACAWPANEGDFLSGFAVDANDEGTSVSVGQVQIGAGSEGDVGGAPVEAEGLLVEFGLREMPHRCAVEGELEESAFEVGEVGVFGSLLRYDFQAVGSVEKLRSPGVEEGSVSVENEYGIAALALGGSGVGDVDASAGVESDAVGDAEGEARRELGPVGVAGEAVGAGGEIWEVFMNRAQVVLCCGGVASA